ncbi:MAG: hypothetical protein AABY22_34240, partial [Nanoarchaeota archaeon]
MSGECGKFGEHTLECKCAINSGKIAIRIMESISNSPEEIIKYTPDALMRVFVYLAKGNGWSLEQMKKECVN